MRPVPVFFPPRSRAVTQSDLSLHGLLATTAAAGVPLYLSSFLRTATLAHRNGKASTTVSLRVAWLIGQWWRCNVYAIYPPSDESSDGSTALPVTPHQLSQSQDFHNNIRNGRRYTHTTILYLFGPTSAFCMPACSVVLHPCSF